MSATTCGAKTRSGTPCAKSAGWGTGYPGHGRCRLHGGASPLAHRGAQLEIAREAAASLGLPRDVAPEVALQEELNRAAGAVEWLGERVRSLAPSDLYGPVGGGAYPAQQPHVLVRLYQEERDRLVKIAAICVSAGVEEWRAAHSEETARQMATFIRDVLTDLDVMDAPETEAIVRHRLGALPSDVAALTEQVVAPAEGLTRFDPKLLDISELRELVRLTKKAQGRPPEETE